MQEASIMKNHMKTIPKYFQDTYCKTASFLRYEHDYVVLDYRKKFGQRSLDLNVSKIRTI